MAPPRVHKPKGGIMISWGNMRHGKISLLPSDYKFPCLTFSNFLTMWYCGDCSKNIAPYRILRAADVRHLKSGKCKLSMMKKLVFHVEREAAIVNLSHLIKRNGKWTTREVIDLYNAVKHLFQFPTLITTKRRYECVSWKCYYNLLCKRKWVLYGEQRPNE